MPAILLLGYSIACFSGNKPARKKRFVPSGSEVLIFYNLCLKTCRRNDAWQCGWFSEWNGLVV